MAFNINKFQRVSSGFAQGANAVWQYTSSTDNMATCVAANYFDSVDVSTTNTDKMLRINDTMYIVASDAAGWVTVTAVTPHATVAAYSIVIGAGSVGNANLAADAVTTDKILDGTILNADLAANTLTSVSIAKNVIQYAAVPVTAVQFAGAYAAPFVLVAAPGANKVIVLESATIEMEFVAAQYTAGGAALIQYDTTVHGAGPAATATVAAATINGWAADHNLKLAGILDQLNSAVVNKGLYLSNATAAFATGDSTFVIHLRYTIIDVTP